MCIGEVVVSVGDAKKVETRQPDDSVICRFPSALGKLTLVLERQTQMTTQGLLMRGRG